MSKEIFPSSKLKSKAWLILSTVSFFTLFSALLLQILLPLDKSIKSSEVGAILWPITLGILLLLWLISVPITILWIKNLKYVIEEDKIVIYKGVLVKTEKNIPFRNITDFILRRTLYDRFLGIGKVMIQTAGQSRTPTGYEGNLAGLLDYEAIHQLLKTKISSAHGISKPVQTIGEVTKNFEISSPILKEILLELKEIHKLLKNK